MITVSFCGGAGGHWLSHTVHRLETGMERAHPVVNGSNHHFSTKSKNVKLTHDYSSENIVLHGQKTFNIFLNYATKNIKDKVWDNKSLQFYAECGSHILEFPDDKIDLNHDNIFLNPDKFIDDLYRVLDTHKIEYIKDYAIASQSITNYCISSADPVKFYDQWENSTWLGWCYGIMKFSKFSWPNNATPEQIYDIAYPDRDFYLEFTHARMANNDIT